MPKGGTEVYEFGAYRLDVEERTFVRIDGVKNGSLPEKAFQTLIELVRNHGRLVAKQELLDAVWPDSFVEVNNLDKSIHAIRHVLGERSGGPKYIETVRGHGYRFVAEVTKPNGGPLVPGQDGIAGALAEAPARSLRLIVGVGLGVVLVTLVGLSFVIFSSGAKVPVSKNFNLSDIQRLTANDSSSHPTISPDGKFVAYVLRGSERLSIQLMQVDTRFTRKLYEPPGTRDIAWLSFSRDGNYVYFVQADPGETGPVGVLSRIGLLASTPEVVLRDVAYFGLSQNGLSLAFVRYARSSGESLLFTAEVDGSDERLIATRTLSEPFSFLDWSTDGRYIAVSTGSREHSGARMYPSLIDVNDGTQRELTTERWSYLSHLLALSDGKGVIANGIKKYDKTGEAWDGGAWHVSYQNGDAELLAGLPAIYIVTGQTADSSTLIAQTIELRTNIWLVELGGGEPVSEARQLTTGNDGHFVTFTQNGRLIFTSTLERPGREDIWAMHTDGSGRRRITDGRGSNRSPVSATDGSYIVFESDRSGRTNLWRMDSDGANLIQLTFGNNEKGPSISPDGRWVYYRSPDDTTIRRVSIEGGESEVLARDNWHSCVVSPDGRSCLSSYREKDVAGWQFGLFDIETGSTVRLFNFPEGIEPNMGYQWMPDGKAFIYSARKGGEYNVWKQPIDGGPAVQLTDLKSNEEIYSPSISPDGEFIAFGRGNWTYDVFLIRNFR